MREPLLFILHSPTMSTATEDGIASRHESKTPLQAHGDVELSGAPVPQVSPLGPPQFPEGGSAAWLTVLGGSVVHLK